MKIEEATAWALDPAAPITPQIYLFLRDRIIHNDLKPGNRISESEIARACDVSRQPVREAFIKLAEQGLLSVRPQRGTIISKIAYSAVLDARFLREAIEADIALILASAADDALVKDLRAQLAEQRDVARTAPLDFIQLDDRFHRTLAEAAGKSGAWKLIEGLKSQMDRVRFLSLGHFPVEKLVEQHTAIVDSIASGDTTGVNAAIRQHLREVLIDLPSIVAANPDFFDLPDGGMPRPVNAPIQGGVKE
ncbi:GntR family transcriptional regulator [Tranquillimonas alkanivorans]|uniref:Transcriptional regulator, GntR family n=1 Tax=Tranquillimonas alkanivorans TaxID=441119 RepID=A0A1I5NUH9_9RHOB|nr:GntR family transcriptional regulator [Tranquillimonas alkanivorans]SFP25444.1 transcriptional regulator, GntR family [Tranquillimonas alkanivorans]